MAVALVQQTTASGSGTASPSLTGVVAGNSLILVYGQPSTASPTYSASGYTLVEHYDGGRCQGVLVKHGSAGGTETPTLNASSGTALVYCWLLEVSGLDTGATPITPAADGISNASTTTAHHCAASGELDTTTGAFLVAVGTLGGTSGGFTAAASWTALTGAAVTTVNAQYYAAGLSVANDRATYSTVTSRGSQNTMVAFPEDTGGGNTTVARSGEFRSGQARSGDSSLEPLSVTVGGVTTTTLWSDLEIRLDLEAPGTASGRFMSSSIAAGEAVEVWRGGVGVGVPLFGGTALQLAPRSKRFSERITTDVTATDYRWLLNQPTRVTTRFQAIGVNVAVHTLINSFAPAGFVAGYLPSTLGNIGEMQFTDETFTRALDRIAAQVDGGAYWTLDPEKRVSMWPTSEDPPHLAGVALAVTDATSAQRAPKVDLDLTGVRTRVICEGGGSQASALALIGATEVAVDETGWYNTAGGDARAAQTVFTYTATSPSAGPGVLTGCSGITDDIPQGETVYVREQADDAGAQTVLATLIGGSGIAVHVVKDGRINAASAAQRATAELTFYDALVRGLSYETDEEVHTLPGRTIAVSITRPAVIAQTVRAQRVTIRKQGAVTATSTVLARAVETRPAQVRLAALLKGEG
jgi:hypothetical protein